MPDNQHLSTKTPLVALANATGTVVSEDQTNRRFRGLKVYQFVSAISGGGSLTLTIQGKDPASGTYYTVLAGSAISAATATPTVLSVYPGITAAANVSASDVLPPIWRVSMAITGGTQVSGTIGFAELM